MLCGPLFSGGHCHFISVTYLHVGANLGLPPFWCRTHPYGQDRAVNDGLDQLLDADVDNFNLSPSALDIGDGRLPATSRGS